LEPVFYVPDETRPLEQVGKAGKYEFVPNWELHTPTTVALREGYEASWFTYQILLAHGVAKEVARVCLPVGIYSSMYATCNPRSLMHFLSLRTKDPLSMFPSYPQWEIEQVAKAMEEQFAFLYPITYENFVSNGRVAP
jgi:thymidylate synthase (FAD)